VKVGGSEVVPAPGPGASASTNNSAAVVSGSLNTTLSVVPSDDDLKALENATKQSIARGMGNISASDVIVNTSYDAASKTVNQTYTVTVVGHLNNSADASTMKAKFDNVSATDFDNVTAEQHLPFQANITDKSTGSVKVGGSEVVPAPGPGASASTNNSAAVVSGSLHTTLDKVPTADDLTKLENATAHAVHKRWATFQPPMWL